MARDTPFEQHAARYEAWFEQHDAAYVSELLALRRFVPLSGRGLEIGVGSGRFAAPLGVHAGIDPSPAMLAEARRVLKPGGTLVIGFIDRASPLGQEYQAHKAESVFYRAATFHSADEVERLLLAAGFSIEAWAQTLSGSLDQAREIEVLRPGRGACAFVVVQARNDQRDTVAPAAT